MKERGKGKKQEQNANLFSNVAGFINDMCRSVLLTQEEEEDDDAGGSTWETAAEEDEDGLLVKTSFLFLEAPGAGLDDLYGWGLVGR